jgi:16S rRNA (guanine(966)-N(2))-methyltransferase RsmD
MAEGLRPTSDRLRETLFNVLAPRIAGARLLDGFAGTGAIGIEAISRGASRVTFVERDGKALRVLSANVAACGVEAESEILRGDVLTLAARRPVAGPFDVIVLDPPYDVPQLPTVLSAVAGLLAPGAVLVLEHSKRRADVPEVVAGVQRYRSVVAGDSVLAFYAAAQEPHHG